MAMTGPIIIVLRRLDVLEELQKVKVVALLLVVRLGARPGQLVAFCLNP